VLNEEGVLVGLLTDMEVYNALLTAEPSQLTVGSMMRKSVRTLARGTTLRSAIRLMNESKQDRVPIIDQTNPKHIIRLINHSQIMTAH
jgi:CBS domain-containing protein